MSCTLHGELGRGNRRPLPACLVDFIRDIFPNEEGEAYVGYRA